MATNERLINIKINSEIKKYETLKKSFLKLYESETKAMKSRIENFDKLNKIQEYDNNELKEIYNMFINEMKSLEDKRNIHLNKIMDLILPVTDYYPEKLKKTKKTLEDLSKVRKTTAKLEKSRNDVKNQDVGEVQRINGEIAKSRNEETKKEITLENEMIKFESERVDDNKQLFLKFIYSELKYHAAALEKMSELFYKIKEKEPREVLEDFAKNLNIEINFSELGIDMDEIKKNKSRRKREEDEEIKEVYDDDDDEEGIGESNKKSIKKSKIKESQRTNNEMNTAILDSQMLNNDDI